MYAIVTLSLKATYLLTYLFTYLLTYLHHINSLLLLEFAERARIILVVDL